MTLIFPDNFEFGVSTAACQIETAFDHDWKGVKSRDNHIFDRTTDHESRHDEDVAIIASLAPNYRMGLMWSKLQHGPFEKFDQAAVAEYKSLFQKLKARNINIMLVLHHFANPVWFVKRGGWESGDNISIWTDYVQKVLLEFGEYVTSYNTFNEPNLYTSLGWVAREFPPFKNNFVLAYRVIKNIAKAHAIAYNIIKTYDDSRPVGISHNCTVIEPQNFFGSLPAAFYDWCFMEFPPPLFEPLDFFGLSYYARITFDPFPITYLNTPGKIKTLNKKHDDMWEYHPEGLSKCIRRYWNQYKKPIIVTENGICTANDQLRIQSIKDYMHEIKKCMDDGIQVAGYYHWTAWDNFEWSLGPTYKFGLYDCNFETKVRTRRPSADLFAHLSYCKTIELNEVKSSVENHVDSKL